MYTTFTFIVQIIVAVYLLWLSCMAAKGLLNKMLFKFVPLVLATLLILNAFNIVK